MKQKVSFPSILIRIKTSNFLTVKLKKFKCMDKIRIEKHIKYQKSILQKTLPFSKLFCQKYAINWTNTCQFFGKWPWAIVSMRRDQRSYWDSWKLYGRPWRYQHERWL